MMHVPEDVFTANSLPEGHSVVDWPDSQDIMHLKEAKLIIGGPLYEEYGDCAFVVPNEVLNNTVLSSYIECEE